MKMCRNSGLNEGKVQARGKHPKIYVFLRKALGGQAKFECVKEPFEN
jgi:hypothetical protein